MAYTTTITNAGAALIAAAIANNSPITLASIVLNDGVDDHATLAISSVANSEINPNWREVTAFADKDVGGFYVRVLKLYAADGTLVATANVPESYKPAIVIGTYYGNTTTYSMSIAVGGATLNYTIPSPAELASKGFVTSQLANYNTLAERGATRNTATYTATTVALTTAVLNGVCFFAPPANGNCTLVPNAGLYDGARIYLTNISVYKINITADITMVAAGKIVTPITLNAGESAVATYDAANNRWVITGDAILRLLPANAATVASFGFRIEPSGLITQWGSAVSNNSGIATLTLPITFPNANLVCRVFGVYATRAVIVNAYTTQTTTTATAITFTNGGATLKAQTVNFEVVGY